MATFIEEVTPYERLTRFNPDGTSNWHFAFRTRILRDGVCISDQAGSPMTAEQAEAAGFPLATVVEAETLAAIRQAESPQTQLDAANARVAELEAQQ